MDMTLIRCSLGDFWRFGLDREKLSQLKRNNQFFFEIFWWRSLEKSFWIHHFFFRWNLVKKVHVTPLKFNSSPLNNQACKPI